MLANGTETGDDILFLSDNDRAGDDERLMLSLAATWPTSTPPVLYCSSCGIEVSILSPSPLFGLRCSSMTVFKTRPFQSLSRSLPFALSFPMVNRREDKSQRKAYKKIPEGNPFRASSNKPSCSFFFCFSFLKRQTVVCILTHYPNPVLCNIFLFK